MKQHSWLTLFESNSMATRNGSLLHVISAHIEPSMSRFRPEQGGHSNANSVTSLKSGQCRLTFSYQKPDSDNLDSWLCSWSNRELCHHTGGRSSVRRILIIGAWILESITLTFLSRHAKQAMVVYCLLAEGLSVAGILKLKAGAMNLNSGQ